jgi:hypothetical protein
MKRRHALLLAMVLGASLAHGAPIIVVADAGGPLHTVDVATGTVAALGNPGVIMADIAFDPSGNLYGISEDKLYRIDTSSATTIASPTLVGNMGIYSQSLVFGADGTLYTATSELYTLSTTTGQATLVGSGGYAYGTPYGLTGDLAFIGGQLYLTAASTDFDTQTSYEDLVALDTGNGHGTLIGHLGSNPGTGFLTVWGLATPDNVTLYGVAGRQVISIDPATATGTLLVNDYGQPPFQFLNGANGAAIGTEAAPIPLPAAAWLIAPAFGLLAPWIRRRSPA